MEEKLRGMISIFITENSINLTEFAKRCDIAQPILWRFFNRKKTSMTMRTANKIISFLKSNSAGIEYPEELKELIA